MLTVKIRKNGELGIFLPIAGMENVQVVTVQTDGEIRWASIGSLPVDKAMHFSAAMRLALYLANTPEAVYTTTPDLNFIGTGLQWCTIDERTQMRMICGEKP